MILNVSVMLVSGTSSFYKLWREFKRFFEFNGLLSPDQIHVLMGAFIFLILFCMLKARSHRRAVSISFISVCVIQTMNEVLDISFAIYLNRGLDWNGVVMDFVHTLIVPIFCFLVYWFSLTLKNIKY